MNKPYTSCDCCKFPLTEDGMTYKGQIICSQKTCRNAACPMNDWTLSPREHKAKCAMQKVGA